MNKPIDRYTYFDSGFVKYTKGEYVKYADHQELLQGLLKSILGNEGVPYLGRKGIVSTQSIIKEFKKLGIE